MTDEEILSNHEYDVYYYGNGGRRNILEAMNEYAKQECLEFKKWCDENEGVRGYANGRSLSIEELYAFYKTPSIIK